jgi:hypothetical protein
MAQLTNTVSSLLAPLPKVEGAKHVPKEREPNFVPVSGSVPSTPGRGWHIVPGEGALRFAG